MRPRNDAWLCETKARAECGVERKQTEKGSNKRAGRDGSFGVGKKETVLSSERFGVACDVTTKRKSRYRALGAGGEVRRLFAPFKEYLAERKKERCDANSPTEGERR